METVTEETTYTLRDGQSEESITAKSLKDAKRQAREWVADGDWNLTSEDRTIWVTVYIDDADGECVDRLLVAVDPPEPECTGGPHDWQSPIELVGGIEENPGVQGHGGGVVSHEVCMRCGTSRYSDSWAQNPETGEEGLDSVHYQPGEFAEEVAAEVA